MANRRLSRLLLVLAAVALVPTGCSGKHAASPPPAAPPTTRAPAAATTSPANPVAAESPVAPEKNPPGDIPDTQVFVAYESAAGGYALEVPEGWARSVNGGDVRFVDKFDGVQVTLSKGATAPTVGSVQREQVPELQRSGRAVQIRTVTTKPMPRGEPAPCVVYTSNSEPDPVTGKQVRLDRVTYYYFHQGTLAALTVWAPAGADNVDQWKRISESFRWL